MNNYYIVSSGVCSLGDSKLDIQTYIIYSVQIRHISEPKKRDKLVSKVEFKTKGCGDLGGSTEIFHKN